MWALLFTLIGIFSLFDIILPLLLLMLHLCYSFGNSIDFWQPIV
nr:MAG TPA: hypothetical protein [Caudoviricetes sp.]